MGRAGPARTSSTLPLFLSLKAATSFVPTVSFLFTRREKSRRGRYHRRNQELRDHVIVRFTDGTEVNSYAPEPSQACRIHGPQRSCVCCGQRPRPGSKESNLRPPFRAISIRTSLPRSTNTRTFVSGFICPRNQAAIGYCARCAAGIQRVTISAVSAPSKMRDAGWP